MAPLTQGSLIVIVGITGWIASYTGLFALKAGYRVRGTVRSMSKAEELRAAYEKEGADVSKLEFVTLDDLMSESQYEAAFAGAVGVIHPALPDIMGEGAKVVNDIIQSVQIPLRVAAKVGITRFVISSTLGTVVTPGDAETPTDRLLTDKDWNERGVQAYMNATEEQKKSEIWFLYVYAAGKTLAEQQAWKYTETSSVPFDLTVVVPGLNWGPRLFGQGTRPDFLARVLKGDLKPISIPPVWLVDVRDDAMLHVLALSNTEASNKRVFAAGHPIAWNEVLAILRKHYPTVSLPEDKPKSAFDPCPWKIDNALGTKMLGGKWISVEETVVDTTKGLGL